MLEAENVLQMHAINGNGNSSSSSNNQNGPRVSFNRDVHVKRIGTRPNEHQDYPVQTKNLQPPQSPNLRRELPKNLSEESILKEAALVLAQAERVKCTAEGGSDLVGGRLNERNRNRIPNKFHSLPSRKKNKKPISRSVSDASAKKSKKPSIFNIFSRKSDSNLEQISAESNVKPKEASALKKIARSKSDAGPSSKDRKIARKRISSEHEDAPVVSKPVQLSPIIENTQREDYFSETSNENQKVSTKNINEKDRNPLTTDTTRTSSEKVKVEDSIKIKKNKDKSPLSTSTTITAKYNPGNIGFTSREDLDLIPTKPIADSIKGTISSLAADYSKSLEDMHSSQLPAEKPPLTKGRTVDGMVKRLSMERFSPPPHLSGPAFSYTRHPNDQVIYAHIGTDAVKQSVRSSHERDDMDSFLPSPYRNEHSFNGYRYSRSPGADSPPGRPPRKSELITSHNVNKSEVYVNENFDSRYRSASPQQITTIRGPQSPVHWKHPSPRNLSDEDEGLGFEPRKYFEEEIPIASPKVRENRNYTPVEFERRRSPTEEPPIVPVIRSVSPVDTAERLDLKNHERTNGMDSRRRENFMESYNRQDFKFNALSNRREALESKIRSRRIGSVDPFEERRSPEHIRDYKRDYDGLKDFREKYLSPEPEVPKFHKINTNEILNKYSPERTHLDMISPARDVKTSKRVETRYYDDGTGGVKETYQKETFFDEYGKPYVRESRHRERLESPRRSGDREEIRYDHEYEPKSLDSQFSEMNRSSPEYIKRLETNVIRKIHPDDDWQNSLKRDKRQQRSFDKGDSGIENDFRKESFNGELTSKWRKRTVHDDIKSCELFIKKERRHTEELHPGKRSYDFIYRERSIDDGSHFDPRLDKYPKSGFGTLKKKNEIDRYSSPPHNNQEAGSETLKREKKIGGLEKVKQLFTGSGKKKEDKKEKELNGKLSKESYMVREDEMRQRYNEYRGAKGGKIPDIATRRRLSTPKASPIPKRTSSERGLKPSSPLAATENAGVKAEKSGWFKSLDRLSRKKAKAEAANRMAVTSTEDELSTIKASKSYRTDVPNISSSLNSSAQKNLRFFGDTDQESNASISRAVTTPRARPAAKTLERNQKHSQSAYNLDRISKPHHNKQQTAPSHRSNSLQNLDGKSRDEVDRPLRRKHHSRSRNLDDISESASDTDVRKSSTPIRHSSTLKISSRENQENDVEHLQKRRYYDDASPYRRSNDRESRSPLRENSDPARIEFRKPPPGPPKPARSMERRQAYSRERERLHDSSGTEGESSLQSQRSVVYLHATTVGAIPQPYHLNRRRAMSRDELSSIRSKEKLQPMSKTVSRSVSMLAPWKPKHLHEGYEINYSQEVPDKTRKHSTMPRKTGLNNNNKTKKTSSNLTTFSNNTTQRSRKTSSTKDDLSSIRNSSITSASKSGLSSNRTIERRSSDLRKDTLNRRNRVK